MESEKQAKVKVIRNGERQEMEAQDKRPKI